MNQIRCVAREGVMGYEVQTTDGARFFGVLEYGGTRKALQAAQQFKIATREYPVVEVCDILTLTHSKVSWKAQYTNFATRAVKEATGFQSSYAVIDPGDWDAIRNAVETSGARLVVLHTFFVPATSVENLCREFFGVRFVVVNHSSLPYCCGSGDHHFAHIAASARIENLFYAVVDDRIPLEHDHMIWMPNPVRTNAVGYEEDGGPDNHAAPWRLSVSGRGDTVKAQFSSITAMALIAQKVPVTAVLQVNGSMLHSWREYLSGHGVTVEACDWVPWENYPGFLRTRVDVGLQPSLTESHNLVGIEHLLAGRPVIGSRSLRYLPADWQSDPENPQDIAEKTIAVLGNMQKARKQARGCGAEEAERCNNSFAAVMQFLSGWMSEQNDIL